MCPDLLGSVTYVRALDRALCESASCRDDGVLSRDKKRGTCTEANRKVISYLYSSEIRLVGRDSCGIVIGEGTDDGSARGEAGSEGLMD